MTLLTFVRRKNFLKRRSVVINKHSHVHLRHMIPPSLIQYNVNSSAPLLKETFNLIHRDRRAQKPLGLKQKSESHVEMRLINDQPHQFH